MLRIWHCLCLLFLLININILIDESYEVIYKIVNQNEPVQYLNCLNLSEIIINKTKIDLNEIKNDFNYHLRWLQKNRKDWEGKPISNETIEKILNQTKSRDYLIYQDRICFIFNNSNDFKSFDELLFELNIYSNYFVFNNETFSFFKLNDIYSSFNQISIQHIEYPYSSCSKDYSNSKCLNEKIKRIQPLSRYLYRSDYNESIELNYQINQTIIDNEIKIIKKCNQIDCKINLFYHLDFNIKSDRIKLKSFLSISKLEFYLQLVGLVVLFLNIPIYKLIIKIINSINLESIKIKILRLKFIKLKLEKFKKVSNKLKLRIKFLKLIKRKYLKRNYLIILILLICLFSLFSGSIYNFIDERDYPSMKSISVDSIKPELSIVICVGIEEIKGYGYNIHNRSLLELEKDTDNGLSSVVKDIYLQFLNKKMPSKWQLESKLVAFKNGKRCFQLRIFLNEPKYQSIFSVTKLIIEFYDKYRYIYVLTDNELFNSESYNHGSPFIFRKRILERSRLNRNKKCKDFNLVDDNCISKWNCIDRCINRDFYNQIKNLTIDILVLDKRYFTNEEWSNLYIRPDSTNDTEIYKNISQKCKDKYSKLDPCIDIKFEDQSHISSESSNKKKTDLNYEVIYYREDEVTIFKLLLDFLNIQSIFFGLNFHSLSFIILRLIKSNLKLIKIFKFLFYLICLNGLIYHLWSIYDEIINIQIIYSQHYELINLIKTPNLIFCFDFNHSKLNQNYKLTYEYLDKITSDNLNANKIFNKIEYLNEFNNWIKLDNKTNFKDNNLEIRIFYYLDWKCYKIIQNIEYNKNQFNKFNKIEDDGLILKIFFNRFYLGNKTFYFFTKVKHKIHFSKIHKLYLNYKLNYKNYYFNYNFLLRITHELIKRDEFELIKNPLSSEADQNDLDKLFTKLINYLDKKLNLVTFKLPINITDLNLKKELDDNLFIQLYNQQQKEHNQTNTNHLRQHSTNYVEFYRYFNLENSMPDFRFNLSFYRKVIVVSNKIRLIKLIINLLNVLSFWFDLGILDLYDYFIVIKLLPIQFYKLLSILLIKIKNKLLSCIL